jgi:hypothetical protein
MVSEQPHEKSAAQVQSCSTIRTNFGMYKENGEEISAFMEALAI